MRTFWNADEYEDHTPLPEHADVAIIGAGIAGLSAARAFTEAGASCVVIERDAVGSGASTRNAGFLMRGAADNYHAGIADLGHDLAKLLWRATEQNHEDLVRLGIEEVPTYERRPSTLLGYSEEEASALRTSADLLRKDGFDVALKEQGSDTLWCHAPPRVALTNPNDAVVNPAHLIAWLRPKVRCPIVEHAAVFDMHAIDGGVSVRTNVGVCHAQRVLVCTNAWASRFAASLPIEPNRGQMLALRVPSTVRLEHAYYANHGSEYVRQATDHTVVVGGWRKHFAEDERTAQPGVTREVQQGLEDFAAQVLGGPFPVSHRWGGIMGFTPDGLPRVGPVGEDERIWVCAGFAGHGMSLAHRTATLSAGAMLENAPPPLWTRPPTG